MFRSAILPRGHPSQLAPRSGQEAGLAVASCVTWQLSDTTVHPATVTAPLLPVTCLLWLKQRHPENEAWAEPHGLRSRKVGVLFLEQMAVRSFEVVVCVPRGTCDRCVSRSPGQRVSSCQLCRRLVCSWAIWQLRRAVVSGFLFASSGVRFSGCVSGSGTAQPRGKCRFHFLRNCPMTLQGPWGRVPQSQ